VCDVELALSAKLLASLDEPHRISRMTEAHLCRDPPPPWASSPSHLEYRHRDRELRRGHPLPEGVRVDLEQDRDAVAGAAGDLLMWARASFTSPDEMWIIRVSLSALQAEFLAGGTPAQPGT
jgi:hypothetical protein